LYGSWFKVLNSAQWLTISVGLGVPISLKVKESDSLKIVNRQIEGYWFEVHFTFAPEQYLSPLSGGWQKVGSLFQALGISNPDLDEAACSAEKRFSLVNLRGDHHFNRHHLLFPPAVAKYG
jgi:hypothetical protein